MQNEVFYANLPSAIDYKNNYNLELFGLDGSISLFLDSLEKISRLSIYLENTKVLFGWNLKSIFSYLKIKTGKSFSFSGKIVDLKALESLFGLELTAPINLRDAVSRFKSHKIYDRIYLPLIRDVIPHMETEGFVDQTLRSVVYPCYNLGAHKNGRLSCEVIFPYQFNPHGGKRQLKPKSYDDLILTADFKAMEVLVLTWLSGDPLLKDIVSRDSDVYNEIWNELTGMEISEQSRNLCKSIFLPVIFGMGSKGLADKIGCDEATANALISRMYNKFAVAFHWVKSSGDIDYFDRKRYFEEGEEWKIRNFIIQSPAAIICLDKLVQLYNNLPNYVKLGYHVHDGFVIITHKDYKIKTKQLLKEILEAEDSFYSGLKLKIDIKENYGIDM